MYILRYNISKKIMKFSSKIAIKECKNEVAVKYNTNLNEFMNKIIENKRKNH